MSIATFYGKFSKIFVQEAWGMKLLDTHSKSPVGRESPPLINRAVKRNASSTLWSDELANRF